MILSNFNVAYEHCVQNFKSGDQCSAIDKIFHLPRRLMHSVSEKKNRRQYGNCERVLWF